MQRRNGYQQFWRDILADYDGQLCHLAGDIGMPYRSLHILFCKKLENVRLAEIIKVARAAGTDPDRCYYLMHKYFYALEAAKPIRGYDW